MERDNELIRKWISAFGGNVDKRILKEHVLADGNYLWHLFTWGNVPCFEKDEARKAFDELQYTEAVKFCGGRSGCIENVRTVAKISAEEIDNDCESDVYIVAKDFTWTYVRTHERESCGPYFCRKSERGSYECNGDEIKTSGILCRFEASK